MGEEARPARDERDDDIEDRARLTQDADGEERAADRPDEGVNGVPSGVDLRNFVGEKFQEVERARDPEDERVAEERERLIFGREDDPVEMNGEAGDEDSQVQIHAGEAGEAEGDAKQLELIHEGNYAGGRGEVTRFRRV